MAFNIREKVVRVGEEELSKYKFKSKMTPDEIKKLALEAKSKRTTDKVMKEKEEKQKYQKERDALRKMHEQLRKDKGLTTGRKDGGKGYLDMNTKSGDEKHLKITFAVIEKMHYSDFNSGNDAEDFKPSDIIDEEDANLSDDEILKKFKNDINLPLKGLSEFDQKTMGNNRIKDTLELSNAGLGLGLGLKQPGMVKGSPR